MISKNILIRLFLLDLSVALCSAIQVSNNHSYGIIDPPNTNRQLTYDYTPGDFTCARQNQLKQSGMVPIWNYRRRVRSDVKQPIPHAWDPVLETIEGCNGLGPGWKRKFSFLFVLDASWVQHYNTYKSLFAKQGYTTLKSSPFFLIDRVSYLYETQFGVSIAAAKVVVLPKLLDACASNDGNADDGTIRTSTRKQLTKAGHTVDSSMAGIVRLGVGSLTPCTKCVSRARIKGLCRQGVSYAISQSEVFSHKDNKIQRSAALTLAHELAHLFGICKNSEHCTFKHTAPEIPDIMTWSWDGKNELTKRRRFYKFFTACTPLYRDVLCRTVRESKCGRDILSSN